MFCGRYSRVVHCIKYINNYARLFSLNVEIVCVLWLLFHSWFAALNHLCWALSSLCCAFSPDFFYEIKYACCFSHKKVSDDGAFAANLSPSSCHERARCRLSRFHTRNKCAALQSACVQAVHMSYVGGPNEILLQRVGCCRRSENTLSRLNCAFLFDSSELFLLRRDSNGANIKLRQTPVALFDP